MRTVNYPDGLITISFRDLPDTVNTFEKNYNLGVQFDFDTKWHHLLVIKDGLLIQFWIDGKLYSISYTT